MPVLVEPRADRGKPEVFARRFDEWISEHQRVWFVFSHPWANEREEWLGHLTANYELLDHFEIADASTHLFALPSGD